MARSWFMDHINGDTQNTALASILNILIELPVGNGPFSFYILYRCEVHVKLFFVSGTKSIFKKNFCFKTK